MCCCFLPCCFLLPIDQDHWTGVEFELIGTNSKNLTLISGEPPTRALFGHTWARVHHHPGQYCRGRYGHHYLKHFQSWRHVQKCKTSSGYHLCNYELDMSWVKCKDSGHHACLDLYPNDGNIGFLPHRYP